MSLLDIVNRALDKLGQKTLVESGGNRSQRGACAPHVAGLQGCRSAGASMEVRHKKIAAQ